MNRIRTIHITDTLRAGGMERMAVNLVNCLPREHYVPFLCTTREEGPLADQVAADVVRLTLKRKSSFDVSAVFRLVAFIRAHNIQIVHAYNASLFVAGLASLFPPHPAVIWHDHYGYLAVQERPFWWLYPSAAGRISGIIAVTQALAEWSRARMSIPTERIWYIPNFVCPPETDGNAPVLPGVAGHRIVCVAQFRPEKDHVMLLQAMKHVVRQIPTAHLFLVGTSADPARRDRIRDEVVKLGLDQQVSLLGLRHDVHAILRGCDVGVLSSMSEGLPLALLEYGMAKLPAVATKTGQCAEVLNEGRAGILVPVGSHDQLAGALVSLLRSAERRAALGNALHRRVLERYSPVSVMKQICHVYETVLARSNGMDKISPPLSCSRSS
jgi:glycosyltransferase involved in cell wall biosynthesis